MKLPQFKRGDVIEYLEPLAFPIRGKVLSVSDNGLDYDDLTIKVIGSPADPPPIITVSARLCRRTER